MRHVAFPTEQDALAFQQELVGQGLAAPQLGRASVSRAAPVMASGPAHGGGTAEDAGDGAVKGTSVGLVAGAVAGALATAGVLGAAAATAVTIVTGGLALPVILGMAALGAGVGAAVGGIGGAAGVDEHSDHHQAYEVDHGAYDALSARQSQGEHVVAVDDSLAAVVLTDTAVRHGGHLI